MTDLKAYVVSDSNGSVVVANMTELEVKDAKIKALEDEVYELKAYIKSLPRLEPCEDEVYELKARIKSLSSELDKAERKAYSGLAD